MKTFIICFILALASLGASAQFKISGQVKDESGASIPFATVYLDETFEGGASDVEGNFQFQAKQKGSYTLVSSAVGYETHKQKINISKASTEVSLNLQESSQVLDPVTVSAGAFGASDKVKGALLEPLDIVMNAGAQGDVFKAIETLPGVSKVGNETGIFVRGGDAHETQTIIDGTIVERPFFSETPNLASRGRFDPFMFKGTTFTTGGYSAEYGGALSSVLLLETQDIPESSTSSIGLNMAGATLSHQQVWNEKTALMADVSYNNLKLLFNSVPQNVEWIKEPEGFGANAAFRHKSKKGLFKSLVQHQQGKISLYTPNPDKLEDPNTFANNNSSTYWNANYKGSLSNKLGIYAGFALNNSRDRIHFNKFSLEEESLMLHGKTTLYFDLNNRIGLKVGAESFREEDALLTAVSSKLQDQHTGIYAESDISLGKRWAFRLGMRSEYSTLLDKANIAPRSSMAYKVGKHSQVSLAYGHFFQKPENEFLFQNQQLDFEQSSHLIANYQWTSDKRSFRIELYDKQYRNLVKVQANGLNNNGEGYSRGIDLFWKDEQSIPHLDYWVSYSYIDAERDYKDYPITATPTFITDHTLNIVANYEIEHLGLQPGITYTFASGRRYINPNSENFLSDKTKPYHNLSFVTSYITELFGNFTVLYGSLSNPFGFEQVFGYEYSADGSQRVAVGPQAKRTFFLGLFMNF